MSVNEGEERKAVASIAARIADIDADAWDACANPDAATFNPFIAHAFLLALEESGSVGERHTAWLPQHITIDDGAGGIAACAPCYAKLNSSGEYVFDHAWASAYAHAGGRYYPKLQIAVPFTPVPGRRLLVRADADTAYYTKVLALGRSRAVRPAGCLVGARDVPQRARVEGARVARLSVAQRPAVPLAQRRLRDVR